MQWWDDLWLNEGFASFMEHYCTDALFPDWKVWEQYTTDAMGHALRLDALKSSHPIQVPIRRAEEVEQVFDAISYCKGSTVVRMACCVLGQDKFREGLRTYMARHKYGNTTTSDLWQAWSDVSGLDVAAIMESWTRKMGYPYLTVVSETWTATSVQLELEQNWFLADGTKDESAACLWSIPVLFSTSKATSDAAVLMQGKRQTFNVPLSHAGDWVKINAGQQALVRVAYTPEMTKRLAVGAIRAGQLSVSDRAAVLLDAYALAKAGLAPVSTVAQLLTCYDQELNSTVWDAISGVLSGLNLLLEEEGGQTHEEFTEFAGKMVKFALEKVGWDAKEGDGHQEKLLRSTIIGLLGNFCWKDSAVSSEAQRRYEAHWTDPSALSSDYKSTVYRIVLKHGGEKEYDAILKTFYATEDNSEKKYAMHTLGAAPQVHLKQRTLDWAVKSGDVKLQDFFYPIGAVASSAAGAAQAWSYFQENFEYVKTKLSKASPSLMDAVIGNSISRFCTKRRADEIEAFFKANPLPSSERRISQLVESIRTNGAMLDLVSASVIAKPGFWTGGNGSLYFE
jgi:puromycin-sensitive aminopeptidase